MKEIECEVCHYKLTKPLDFCPRCFTPIQMESPTHEEMRIGEVEKPENARWLALLVDTEGSMGWTRRISRRDRINGYRYIHKYSVPYLSVEMNELESAKTVEEGAKLITTPTRTRFRRGVKTRLFVVGVGKALTTMNYIKPHLVKFRRLANLCLTIFKHPYIPLDQFEKTIETLFGRYVTSKEANEILLTMTEEEYMRLLANAEKLAPK